MANLMKELEGFVVFEPIHGRNLSYPLYLAVTNNTVRPAKNVLVKLKNASYIVAFFDDMHQRMMLMAADEKMENTFHITYGQKGKYHSIFSLALAGKILQIAGIDPKTCTKPVYFEGHTVEDADGKVIFDLSKCINRSK